jgi:hypothetical protein
MLEASVKKFKVSAAKKKPEIEKRCQIGVFIQDMFKKDVEFRFEYENVTSFDHASETELIALLQPVSYPKANLYIPDSAWPKPSSWPWSWPNDPTWAPLDACETCGLVECTCFTAFPQDRHRIVHYGSRGRGIQARAAVSGGLAFREGEYIQELVGEVKPLGWPTDHDISIDFERPDVGVTCRLHYGVKSNWARLVSYACDPCAEIVVRVLPGRAILVLRARRDIWDGMEITVDYGKSA